MITLISKLFGITPYEAAKKLADDYGILLSSQSNAGMKSTKSTTNQLLSQTCTDYRLEHDYYLMEQRMIRGKALLCVW